MTIEATVEGKESFCNGLTQKQLLDWYYHLNTVSIPMYLKEKTADYNIFDKAIILLSVFCKWLKK